MVEQQGTLSHVNFSVALNVSKRYLFLFEHYLMYIFHTECVCVFQGMVIPTVP